MWLTSDYMRTPQLFRPEAEAGAHFPFMIAAFLLLGFSFSWIYRQGISPERQWLSQGIRFGLAAALIAQVPMYLIYYVVQPMEGMTTAKQIIGDTVTMIVCGIVVAFINKSATRVTV
jgi:glucose uptake protein GlcU